jgi:hypothetical protein
MKLSTFVTALIFGAGSLADAAEFITPANVYSPNAIEFYPVINLVQGPDVGFDSIPPHNALGAGQPYAWVTDAPGGYPSDYIAVAGEPILIVDLGADTDLAEISVWGYAATNDNGVKDFRLRFGTEAEGEAGIGTSITYNPTFTAIQDPVPRQSFLFDRIVRARYVEVTCASTFFRPPGNSGGDRVGLGEISFEKFVAPPEANLVAPEVLVFPPTREVSELAVTVRNTGLLPLTLSAATIGGADAAAFTVVSKPTTLNTLQAGDVVVRFTPPALPADFTATLTLVSNDPDTPNFDVALTATVPPPPVEFFPITSITSSTQDTDLYPVENLYQGSGVGFAATFPHDQLGAGPTHRWVTADPGGYPSDYIEVAGAPVLTIDLGENRVLNEINVWGYTATNHNGVREFQLRFATAVEGPAGFGTSITYNPTFVFEENNDVLRFAFPFEQQITARYVEFTCLDNFFTDPGTSGGDRVGLGEIAFPSSGSVGPAVPLVVTSVQRNTTTGAITLTFTSESGKTYTVERSRNLKDWSELASEVPATGAATSYTDSDILASDREFYYKISRP